MCEEFGCLPSQALAEISECPGTLLWDVLEMRAYARTKELLAEAAKGKAGEAEIEITPMVELVQSIQAEIDAELVTELKAEIQEARADGGNG